MTPPPIPDNQLREQILKAALVKSEVVRWEKSIGEPIKVSNQPIVEIGIDDLMSLIEAHTAKQLEAELSNHTDQKGVE